ncbi:MAG: filamentous hemagglutinin family protein [Rhodoplanes sp.]|uniref:filamentous haemagglutinin family protein n=1 Tax=Rhodoplanes sp. TaxID=1968906 RepID=UPI0017CABAD7|nr:filamentous haemagglutinin family protein [Rhodoplanes sp.]NVO13521.1 filamentous hemagglutinin family protein [Rhodoplanes sp.]
MSPVAAATAAQAATSAQASAAARQSMESLARATQALKAMRDAQSAANALARSAAGTVPNGLVPGGLMPVANPNSTTDGLTAWVGAAMPTQSTGAGGAVDVTVRQTQSNAILSWQSFNVGRATTLTFDQQGNPSWIALNRIVGTAAPSQILGSIKADGTVLVINQNGIVFGAGAQVNVNALIATSLDVGRVADFTANTVRTIAQRNQEFLDYGLLGYADSNSGAGVTFSTTSAAKIGTNPFSYPNSGSVRVENGAKITSGDGGYILLAAPNVTNAGHLVSTDGQVILAAGDSLTLTRATGASDSADPGIRGFFASVGDLTSSTKSVVNLATGLIESPRGSILMTATVSKGNGAVVNAGGLFSTTGVSRNGAIEILGASVEIAPGSVLSILPDDNGETIPQDQTSLAAFKRSQVVISGSYDNASGLAPTTVGGPALIDIGANALVYVPSGNVTIGVSAGQYTGLGSPAGSRVFVDTGAVIDVSGLQNVPIPASRNTIDIKVTTNDLADTSAYRNSFLYGTTVTVDPRLSGVRSDGVAWIGSPLINATSYYQQVGVSAAELMTRGGNVTLGAASFVAGSGAAAMAPNVILKPGAVVNVAGGWVTYQAGVVHTTRLIDASGRIVDIGKADPNATYVGVYDGSAVKHAHWGVTDTFTNLLRPGGTYQAEYTEGRDAGSLALVGSAAAFDGTLLAEAFAGVRQIAAGTKGTGTASVYGDSRAVQAAPSQLPAGGYLLVQAQGIGGAGAFGGDIVVVPASDYQANTAGLRYGQVLQVAADGSVTIPTRDPASYLSAEQMSTIRLSDALLSGSGLAAVSLGTSGNVTVPKRATVSLAAGGVFTVLAGRKITIDGTVSVPSGQIALTTYDSNFGITGGSVFAPSAAQIGDHDIVVDGTLSVAGRWVNDFGADAAGMAGPGWLDGGSITLYAAPRVTQGIAGATTTADLSGSILINHGALLDLSGGGRVDRNGKLNLSAHGGNLSLYAETSWFEIASWVNLGLEGTLSGFRITGQTYSSKSNGIQPFLQINPDTINARVSIDAYAIRAQGFAGGGTFTLTTPEFAFSDDTASTASAKATRLPLSFFSSAGFSSYKITSYKTDLFTNPFNNGLGGTDAILATQTLTVGVGQTLNLVQSVLPAQTAAQLTALRALGTGGDLFSVLTPGVPADAYDQKPVSLTLGGLLELHVAQGGSVTGAAGASLGISALFNEGTIRLPGGTIVQQTILPPLYTIAGTLGIRALSDAFTINPDGSISEATLSKVAGLTNAQLAGAGSPAGQTHPIYELGLLDPGEGIRLASGSVTDLSGVSLRNPDAVGSLGQPIVTGRIVAGGTLATLPVAALTGQTLFRAALLSPYLDLSVETSVQNGTTTTALGVVQAGRSLVVAPGAVVDLSGTSDLYEQPVVGGTLGRAGATVATPVWSDAGTLSAGAGATLTGAIIKAVGGAAQAEGGTLVMLDPVLTQHDPATPAANLVSADMITAAGFTTLVALGSVSNAGDATITLGRAFFLESRPVVATGSTISPELNMPTIKTGGGTLTIDAPYVALVSPFETMTTPALGAPGSGRVVFDAEAIDVTGTVLIDRSVGSATFNASGDIRLTGVVPYVTTTTPTLTGRLAANGDLAFTAAQLYPTTGSSFAITTTGTSSPSTSNGGLITFARAGDAVPVAPYSAGGNLTVEAANIVQGGVIRVPLGTLTLGGSSATVFAPATQNLTLAAGGITSVSANGLVIPYGTTTDQTEWYFAPTATDALAAPPQKLLGLSGRNISIQAGATVDLTGGGDVYAYEFVPGTGGSRDVLNRLNPDAYTSRTGTQYPDGRQVYAIVPGLSSNPVAAYDPIYSAGYGSLSSVTGAGTRVWLDGGNGLSAGWYTLLPAQYATLPGGLRVVEMTGAGTIAAGTTARLLDGSVLTTGRYGSALSGAAQSAQRVFEVMPRDVIDAKSKITLTTGNSYFATLAAHAGAVVPRLPLDAGRLVVNASATLEVDTVASTTAAAGGRGAQVDITGPSIDILASLAGAPADGALHITAASLSNLNADSLLVGGTRTDNADGTTTLLVAAQTLLLANDAGSPLKAGEILLAATGTLTLADGAAVTATGTLSDRRTGAYKIGSDTVAGTGALVRVANGPQRLVARTNAATTARLAVGAATLDGTAVMFDSSGADTIDPGLVLRNAKYVALGAPRIGFGANPASYNGLVVTDALVATLTGSGAALTVRSQSSIDFAAGTYNFADIGFDAAALSGLDNGDVVISGNTVSLGNAGAAGTVCTTCSAGTGTLAIAAKDIVFTGGAMATVASKLTTSVPVKLAADTTVMLPAGTVIVTGTLNGQNVTATLRAPTAIIVPAGTALTATGGTGFVLPDGADGTVAAGSTVTFAGLTLSLPAGSSYYFPNGFSSTSGAGSFGLITAVTTTVPVGTQTVLAADATAQATSFFRGVTLAASNGVFAQGAGSALSVGAAPLTIHTPYLGDRATALASGATAAIPDLTLTSAAAVTIDTLRVGARPVVAGIPGSDIAISGQSVSVAGTDIRATAGRLLISSATGIALSGGAILEAPGYTARFGDSADPVYADAAGGAVTLAAKAGAISLGDATLSVGGGTGNAGTLTLSVPNGAIDLGTATLNGTGGPNGAGGTFALDTSGNVDLVALNTRVGAFGFTGGFNVHTDAGNLVLAAGQRLRSGSVNLTADGGFVDIAGTIDTSGVNGGDVALYGRAGVRLASSAVINAYATGYAADDTRQAKAGNVTLGTDFVTSSINSDGSVSGSSGAISIARGAVIDVAAKRPGDRLVPYYLNGAKYYHYVEGDVGGTLTLRAPVTGTGGNRTVAITVDDASSVRGASAVNLVGFQRWDLGKVADSTLYTGVTRVGTTVTLDVSAGLDTANTDGTLTTVAGINFLGDKGNGAVTTVVDFVQGFALSAGSYGGLGGLASLPTFHAQPGIDLTYAGNVTLASNWNLGAGIVNQTAAVAGNAMAYNAGLLKNTVVTGQEANLLLNYTQMLYRVDGRITGEPAVLNLRAGGTLDLKGSITDGFFTFRDQTDPAYLNKLGTSVGSVGLTVQGGCSGLTSGVCKVLTEWSAFTAVSGNPSSYLAVTFSPGVNSFNYLATPSAAVVNAPPYNAAANSPAALGSFPSGTGAGTSSVANGGDPIGSAVVFPLLDSSGRVARSTSYDLVAGADVVTGGIAAPSADPSRTAAATTANLIVEGLSSYTYARNTGSSISGVDSSVLYIDGNATFGAATKPATTDGTVAVDQWITRLQASVAGANVKSTGAAELILNSASSSGTAFTQYIDSLFVSFATARGLTQLTTAGTVPNSSNYKYYYAKPYFQYVMSVSTLNDFLTNYIKPNAATIASYFTYTPPAAGTTTQPVTAYTKSLVRTGTGNITLAATGNIDLTNGPVTMIGGYQVGGTSVYTAGHPVVAATSIVADPETGQLVAINLANALPTSNNLAAASSYAYGISTTATAPSAWSGVLVADPVALEGGGAITVSAGADVLGRRDAWLQVSGGLAWTGSNAEPWRIGATGANTYAAINPQVFTGGVATLGGGNIAITAGRSVSDLAVVATDSLATATATGAGVSTKAIAAFGGGDVTIAAGGNIFGGRVDVASGAGLITAGGDITANGRIPSNLGLLNLLRLYMSDATIDIEAGGSLTLQGVAALGPKKFESNSADNTVIMNNLAASTFYSDRAALSLAANGSVTVTNRDDYLLTYSAGAITPGGQQAVYPGSLRAVALTGDLAPVAGGAYTAKAILLAPSPAGQLSLYAGGDIAASTIAMLDTDPGWLPGALSSFQGSYTVGIGAITSGTALAFPAVLPSTSDITKRQQHAKTITHANDPEPVRIYAGGDIGGASGGVILSVPKQARVFAGEDIVNMMFFGQNLASTDITRIVAGRDITATTVLTKPGGANGIGTPEPALQGNTFVIGGPGDFTIEAGRDLGPFLNSATVTSSGKTVSYGGGILSIGNEWNPWLPAKGADITVMFGVAKGADFAALRDAYLVPGSAAAVLGRYSAVLDDWMKKNAADVLLRLYGTTDVSDAQAYDAFKTLPELRQRIFLLGHVYFDELQAAGDPNGPSYLQYSRGYTAVNTLFPAALGYTANNLSGGSNGANALVPTGNLDLRLATIQTEWGGDIRILGPGGRVIAGSTVRTDAQAARRTYDGSRLFYGNTGLGDLPSAIKAIPAGYEGVLTLRGGAISTFTDQDFLLNQSRLFTEQGGDILMWSSNADLNAGQGPKTSSNFPPVLVKIDPLGYVREDKVGATTGAGIAALQATPKSPRSDVTLLAPRGAVDAGAAGIRVSGNLSIAALYVFNAFNIQVQGTTTGVPVVQAPAIAALTAATSATAATQKLATPTQGNGGDRPSVIIVEILGYGGGEGAEPPREDKPKPQSGLSPGLRVQNPASAFQVLGAGEMTIDEARQLLAERRSQSGDRGDGAR